MYAVCILLEYTEFSKTCQHRDGIGVKKWSYVHRRTFYSGTIGVQDILGGIQKWNNQEKYNKSSKEKVKLSLCFN
jgi:hypothetical protein